MGGHSSSRRHSGREVGGVGGSSVEGMAKISKRQTEELVKDTVVLNTVCFEVILT